MYWRPLRIISSAMDRLVRRVRKDIPPIPGNMPNNTSGKPAFACFSMMTTSQESAHSNPPTKCIAFEKRHSGYTLQIVSCVIAILDIDGCARVLSQPRTILSTYQPLEVAQVAANIEDARSGRPKRYVVQGSVRRRLCKVPLDHLAAALQIVKKVDVERWNSAGGPLGPENRISRIVMARELGEMQNSAVPSACSLTECSSLFLLVDGKAIVVVVMMFPLLLMMEWTVISQYRQTSRISVYGHFPCGLQFQRCTSCALQRHLMP